MVHYITIVGSDLEVLDNETPETLLNRDHLSLIQKLMNDYENKNIDIERFEAFT